MSGFIHGSTDFKCGPDRLIPVPVRFSACCDDCAVEAWERMTTGGVGFHPKRALINYVGEFSFRASQTKYVREGAVVTR